MFVNFLPRCDRDIGTLQYEQSGRFVERLHDASRAFQRHSVNVPLRVYRRNKYVVTLNTTNHTTVDDDETPGIH